MRLSSSDSLTSMRVLRIESVASPIVSSMSTHKDRACCKGSRNSCGRRSPSACCRHGDAQRSSQNGAGRTAAPSAGIASSLRAASTSKTSTASYWYVVRVVMSRFQDPAPRSASWRSRCRPSPRRAGQKLAVLSSLVSVTKYTRRSPSGLLDIRPVRVVAAERRVDFERRGKLREHEHLLLLVESLREGALDSRRVVDHVVVQALACHVRLPRVLPEVGRVVVELEVARGVPARPRKAHVLDALGDGSRSSRGRCCRRPARGRSRGRPELVEAAAAPSRIALMVPRAWADGVLKLCNRAGRVVFHLSRNGHQRGAVPSLTPASVDAQRCTLARLGRAHGEHAVDRLDGTLDELAGVDLDLEARALAMHPQAWNAGSSVTSFCSLTETSLALSQMLAHLWDLWMIYASTCSFAGSSSAGSSTLPSSAAAFSLGVTAPLASRPCQSRRRWPNPPGPPRSPGAPRRPLVDCDSRETLRGDDAGQSPRPRSSF